MRTRDPTLAAFTAIIGMLALILTVSVLAEKAHEAHLPERNGRATCGALVSSGLPAGILLLLSALKHVPKARHRQSNLHRGATPSISSRCTMREARSAMAWPMRLNSL